MTSVTLRGRFGDGDGDGDGRSYTLPCTQPYQCVQVTPPARTPRRDPGDLGHVGITTEEAKSGTSSNTLYGPSYFPGLTTYWGFCVNGYAMPMVALVDEATLHRKEHPLHGIYGRYGAFRLMGTGKWTSRQTLVELYYRA